MFVSLFFVSFLVSLGIAGVVGWASKEPIEGILHHFFPMNASLALSKYLRLAMGFIAVSSGARIQLLEEYIAASPANKIEMSGLLTQEFWVTELYRTAIRSVEGILWLLLLFSLIVFVAYLVMRKVQTKQQSKETNPNHSNAPAD